MASVVVAPRSVRRSIAALTAAGLVAGGLAIIWLQHRIRIVETALASGFVRLTGGQHVGSLGTNVLFLAKGHYVGIAIDAGCSAAFLVAPFLLLGAALLATGRVTVRRCLTALAIAVAVTFVTNQIRIAAIAVAIRNWGIAKGYERSHVLIGTVVSTVGVLLGILVFFYLVTRGGRTRRAGGDTDG